MATADFDIPSPVPQMPAASAKQTQRAQRAARTEHVRSLIDTLVTLVAAFTVVVGYSPNPKQQAKLTKAATDEKKFYVDKISMLHACFTRFSKPSQHYNKVASFIRNYTASVNWLNMLTAQFRKLDQAARDKLSDFEKFVLNHRFPMYDFTNGFESDDDVEARIEALMNPVLPTIVSKSDGNSFDLSEEKLPKYFLKSSQRSVIVATDSHDYFMACIKTGIENATLVHDYEAVGRYDKMTRFSQDVLGDFHAGMFDTYSLKLKFRDATDETREITLHSTCAELKSRFTTVADLTEFAKLCKHRMIHLLTARDPERQQNEIVVFCQHVGCDHEDGFLFHKRPTKDADFHRVGSACPSGHAFCLRCLQQDHEGFCPDMRQEREELAAMPGQKMCPTCRTIIFKNGGCNHMHCTACDQHFCWTCSTRFSSSEQYRQHGTCRQYD
jgi:hypothetical protein